MEERAGTVDGDAGNGHADQRQAEGQDRDLPRLRSGAASHSRLRQRSMRAMCRARTHTDGPATRPSSGARTTVTGYDTSTSTVPPRSSCESDVHLTRASCGSNPWFLKAVSTAASTAAFASDGSDDLAASRP